MNFRHACSSMSPSINDGLEYRPYEGCEYRLGKTNPWVRHTTNVSTLSPVVGRIGFPKNRIISSYYIIMYGKGLYGRAYNSYLLILFLF